MQTIANSELVRIFMQRKLQNYQKRKWKKNEQKAKPCCSCAPCVNSWAKQRWAAWMTRQLTVPDGITGPMDETLETVILEWSHRSRGNFPLGQATLETMNKKKMEKKWSLGQAWNDGTLGRLQALKTGISRGNFPEQIRDPLIRSGNHSNRFRHRIRRIFPDFFPNPFFPEKTIFGREFRYSVSVGTGISRSRFHP